MLFYAGLLPAPGDVDSGNTITDFLPQERERGITIRSAAISFNWLKRDKAFQVNLIDTPGHVDFQYDVIRCSAVLDSFVFVVDGTVGLQTQTHAYWKQQLKAPRIVFVNKMDLQGSNLEVTINQVKNKLNEFPLQLQLPLGEQMGFKGVIDLVALKAHEFLAPYGLEVVTREIGELPEKVQEQVRFYRNQLIENLANLDDTIADKYLNNQTVSLSDLQTSIRNLTLKRLAIPIFCGSAVKNKGIQPLLDGMSDYLASPQDHIREELIKDFSNHKMVALGFKIQFYQNRTLVFTRVYKGSIKVGQMIYNVNKQAKEKVNRIYRVQGEEFVEQKEIGPGEIAALWGLESATSGDTFIVPEDVKQFSGLKLPGLTPPPPVFFCKVDTYQSEQLLEDTMKKVVKEDPSLQMKKDRDGANILLGQGELQIEILKDRIKREHDLEIILGKFQVQYIQSLRNQAQGMLESDRPDGYFKIALTVKPMPLLEMQSNQLEFFTNYENKVSWDLDKKERVVKDEDVLHSLHELPREYVALIGQTLKEACEYSDQGYPWQNLEIIVTGGLWSKLKTKETIIKETVSKAIKQIIQNNEYMILEPVMSLNISLPTHYLGTITNDLASNKQAFIQSIQSEILKNQQNNSNVLCQVPLRQLLGYSTTLRSMTRGEASYFVQFSHYQEKSNEEEDTREQS